MTAVDEEEVRGCLDDLDTAAVAEGTFSEPNRLTAALDEDVLATAADEGRADAVLREDLLEIGKNTLGDGGRGLCK